MTLLLSALGCSQPNPVDRAAELDSQIEVLVKEGRFAEAAEFALERLKIVRSKPDANPYETTYAQLELSKLKQIAELPRSTRDDLAKAAQLDSDMREDFQNGEYTRAAESARIQLEIRRQHLGNSHVDVGTTLNNLAYA
jgi:hypothetical protein